MEDRYDADENVGLWVSEQLIDRSKEAFEAPILPMSSFELLPPSPDSASSLGFKEVARQVYVENGKAQIIAYGADDLPLVDVGVIEDKFPIVPIGCAYRITVGEARTAMKLGRPLENRKLMAARNANMRVINDLFFFGNVLAGVPGLLRNSSIPRVIIPAASLDPTADVDVQMATALQLLTQVQVQSGHTEKANTLALPAALYSRWSLARSSTLNNNTIMTSLLEITRPMGVTIVAVPEFDTAGPTGGMVMAALSIKPDKAEHIVPDLMTVMEQQPRNTAYFVPVIAESAGFVTEFPLAHAIGEVDAA